MQPETSAHLPVNHVFVDFENVKTIDTSVIGGKHLRLHVFLGPQNKKLDVDVVEKLLEHAQAVQLIRVATVGRNALDFVLAYHLGQAVLTDPKGYFHIVSRDKGFNALVDLLKSRQVELKRHEDWSELNFQSTPKPPAGAPEGVANVQAAPYPAAFSDAAKRLFDNLRKTPKNRPKKEKTLVTHAMNFFGKDKPNAEADAEKVIGELKKAKFIAVDDKGVVTYRV